MAFLRHAKIRVFAAASALLSLVVASSLSSNLSWAGADLRPAWVGKPASSLKPNNSFLSDVESNLQEARAEALERRLFDEKRAAQIRQDYESLARDYEMKRSYGLNDPVAEQQYYERFKNNRSEAFKHVRARQAEQTRRSLNEGAKRGEVSAPVMITGTVASIYFGNPVHLNIDEDTKIVAKADFISEKAEVRINSNVVDGSFDLASDRAFEEMKRAEPDKEHERYRFSLNRGLPFLNLSSGISYGGTTEKLTASLSRPIADNLTCILENSVPVGGSAAKAEEKIRFEYSLNF